MLALGEESRFSKELKEDVSTSLILVLGRVCSVSLKVQLTCYIFPEDCGTSRVCKEKK